MPTYRRGDVLLVEFPFSDNPQITKKRPAILLEDAVDDHVLVKCTKTDKSKYGPCICIDVGTSEHKLMNLTNKTYISVSEEVTLSKWDIVRYLGECPEHIMDEIDKLRNL